jgi:hypothetical protein
MAAGLSDLQPDLVAFIEAIVTDDYDQVTDLLGRSSPSSNRWNRSLSSSSPTTSPTGS